MDAQIRKLAKNGRKSRLETPVVIVGADAPERAPDAVAEPTPIHVQTITLSEQRREAERILAPGAPGPVGAAYKMLRTQVLRRLASIGANTLAILSVSTGEGKTLTALNLAIAIAADLGHTALVVDLDLRNPSVHERLGISPKVGIDDCLAGRRPIGDALVRIAGYERLKVLPARQSVAQSSELISSQRMADLMQELRGRYADRVLLFDLPPVLLADDALAFSRLVQAGLFVVSERKTERAGLTRSLLLLDNLPIIGTVLNRSSERLGAYY
jgi:Mrp family chromosome partitioning ATPase